MKIEIYLPDKDFENMPVNNSKAVYYMSNMLCELFGGSTIIDAIGCYKGMEENTVIVYSFTDSISNYNLDIMKQELLAVKNELRQEKLMYTINNEAYFL